MKDLERPKMFAELMELQPLGRFEWLHLLMGSGCRFSSATQPMLRFRWASKA